MQKYQAERIVAILTYRDGNDAWVQKSYGDYLVMIDHGGPCEDDVYTEPIICYEAFREDRHRK